MKRVRLLMVALAVAGCASAMPRVDAVHAAQQCPLLKPVDAATVQVLGDAVQWERVVRTSAAALLGREVRWSDERVVVFSLGRQPTLGVRVDLASRQLTVSDAALQFKVKLQRPGPDEMAATALSWPCVMAVVPREGWSQVRVLDEAGALLATSAAGR